MTMLRMGGGPSSLNPVSEILNPGFPSATELSDIPGLVALWDATALSAGSLSNSSTIPNLVNPDEPLTFGTDVFDRADTTFDGRTYVVLKNGSGYSGADFGRMRCQSWFGSGSRRTGQYAFILLGAGSSVSSSLAMGCLGSDRRQLASIVALTSLYNNNFGSAPSVNQGVFRRQNRLFEPILLGACNYDNASAQGVENIDTYPEHDVGGEGNFFTYQPTLQRVGTAATRVNANTNDDMLIGGNGTSFFAAAVLDLTSVAAASREAAYRNCLALMWNHFVLKGRSMLFIDGDSLTDNRTVMDAIPGELDPYSEPGWTIQLKSIIKNRYVVKNFAAAGKQHLDQPGYPGGNTSPVGQGSKNLINGFMQLCKYRNRPLTIHGMNAMGFNGSYTNELHISSLKQWATDVRSYDGSGITTQLHWIRTPTSSDTLNTKNSLMEAEFDAGTSGYNYSYFDQMNAHPDPMFHNPDPFYTANPVRSLKKLAGKFIFWHIDNRIPGFATCQTRTVTSDGNGNATVSFTPLAPHATGVPANVDVFGSTDPAIIANGSKIADAGLLTNFMARTSSTPVVIENLIPNTTYYFVIAGVDRLHPYGASYDFFAQAYVPWMAPNLGVSVLPSDGMSLRAVAGNAQISLSMTAVSGATHYEWHRASGATLLDQLIQSPDLHGGKTLLATTTVPTYVDTSVNNGTWYHYRCVGRSGTPGNYIYSALSTRASNLPAVVPAIPVNTTAPVISGNLVADEALTTTKGKWTNIPYDWSYQWTRNGTPISAATNATYTITPGDVGANILCQVTAQNCIGYSVAANSNTVVPIPGSVARESFIGTAVSGSDLTTYNFSAQAIGAARSDRQVLVCVNSRKATQSTISATLTINGTSATQVQQIANVSGGAANYAGMFLLNVPTGTTGDVSITFNAPVLRCGIQVYRLTGLNSTTPVDLYSSTSTLSDTLTISTNSVVIACANSGGAVSSWTGVTEDNRLANVAGESLHITSASAEVASAGTRLVSVGVASPVNDTILIGVWA